MSRYQWAEDDFLPVGVTRLTTVQPEDGHTYVMYHGTTRASAEGIRKNGFQRSADGMLGPGVYLSRDLEKARRYPIDHPDEDRIVIKVKVNVGRVIAINRQNHPYQKTWSSYGDSAWVPPNCGMVKSGLEENCVWDPRRIQVIQIIKPQLLQGSSRAAPRGSSRAPPRGSSRVASRGSSRAASRGSSRAPPRGSSRAAPRGSSRVASRGSSRAASRGSSRAASRGSSRAPPRGSSRAPPRGSSRAAPRGSSRAASRGSSRAPRRGSSRASFI